MESGKISFGFLLLLLLIFALVGGVSWLSFSNTKTGVPLIDDNIAKVQAILSPEAQPDLLPIDQHAHDGTTQDHETGATSPVNADIPGKEGVFFDKPVNPLLGVRGVGEPNAPIQIREFFSLTCNHCATFHQGTFQELKQNYIDTGKVYFIFEEFPLNGPALYGSMIARCMPEDRYESFIALLLSEQDKWAFGGDFKAALKQNAALAGMGDEEFEACFNNKELQKAVAVNIQESSDNWKISSTPSFVFNNGQRVMSGVNSLENFEKVIAFLNGETLNNETMPVSQTPELPVIETPVLETPVIEQATDIILEEMPIEVEVPAPAPEPAPESTPEITPEVGEEKPAIEDTTIDINELFAR